MEIHNHQVQPSGSNPPSAQLAGQRRVGKPGPAAPQTGGGPRVGDARRVGTPPAGPSFADRVAHAEAKLSDRIAKAEQHLEQRIAHALEGRAGAPGLEDAIAHAREAFQRSAAEATVALERAIAEALEGSRPGNSGGAPLAGIAARVPALDVPTPEGGSGPVAAAVPVVDGSEDGADEAVAPTPAEREARLEAAMARLEERATLAIESLQERIANALRATGDVEGALGAIEEARANLSAAIASARESLMAALLGAGGGDAGSGGSGPLASLTPSQDSAEISAQGLRLAERERLDG